MPTNVQLTGATIPLTITGKDFQANPLTDRDNAELDAYVKKEIIATAVEAAESLPKSAQEKVLDAAIRQASGISWSTDEGSQVMASLTGTIRLAYQMIKRNHDIGWEEFKDHFMSDKDELIRNIQTINRVFIELNTPTEEDREREQENSKREVPKNLPK